MSAQDVRARRLARLAARVDWSRMIDPYTGEQYGPEVLAALWATDPITADRTCQILHYTANGDGSSVRAAAAEMLPFLVEAARDPDVTVRFEILRTIADIADTGNTAPSAKVDPILEGRWRPTVAPAWPAAWERVADALLPLLDDGNDLIRAGAVGALAQSAAHADTLIPRLRTCFENEPDLWMAERLVLAVGELARYAIQRREETLAWLRFRMTVEGKGEEPDFDEDIDAWVTWDEEVRHDVRLQAAQALRRALPDHTDPR
ncbi:HEAT repeat domain-containing protein [Streptomyces sp. NPDC058637]|uniref:HEAT repeat domain-containing protein n=1 Tax=Streptomyces sp. NPDC058637 TaxID=3346569 RepID=UPI00364F8E9B